MSKIGHNSQVFDGDRLRAFIERVEVVETEIKDRQEHRKEIYAEARSSGYCIKITHCRAHFALCYSRMAA